MKSFLTRLFTILKISGWARFSFLAIAIVFQGVSQAVGIGLIFPFLNLISLRQETGSSGFPIEKLPPWASSLVDSIPGLSGDNLIFWACICTITGMVAANGIGFLADYYKGRFSQFCSFRISLKTIEIISQKPYIYYLNTNTNESVKKILQDIILFTNGILLPFVEATSRTVLSILLVTMMVVVNPLITGIACLIFGIPYLVIFLSLKKTIREMDVKRNQYTKLQIRSAYEFFHGIKAILANQRKDYFVKRFADNSFELALLNARMPAISSAPRYALETLAFCSLVATVLIIEQRGLSLQKILPTLSLFALAGYRLLPSLQLIYGSFTSIIFRRKAMDEVYEEIFLPSSSYKSDYETIDWQQIGKIKPIHFAKELVLENIRFTYPGTQSPVIDNISLSIPKGHKVGFVGKTGSGKSTLIDIILGLHQPDEGRIITDTTEISSKNMVAWRKAIGYVPQDIFLTDEPLYKNIAFGIPEEQIEMDKVVDAARRAQISDFIENDLDKQYETMVGEGGVRLSGGQKQRIGLARALYLKPELLILDEATSALDNNTEDLVMEAINQLSEDITIIMIAHRLSTVKECNTIFYLDHGKLTGQGSFEELQATHAAFAKLSR